MSSSDPTPEPSDFPKLHSPFVREENDSGEYVVTPEVQDGHEWVFDDAERVVAAEKLHGTNVSAVVDDGHVRAVYSREGDGDINRIDPFTTTHGHLVDGVQRAARRGWLDDFGDAGPEQVFGELIGEKVHGNPYDIDGHLFVPFDYLCEHCAYRSYGDYPTDFDSISEWFRDGLFSLFYARWHDVLDDVDARESAYVEGVVFHHPDTGEMSKLRRDMFEWFDGERH